MSEAPQRLFKLDVDRETGSLERVLGVARRRGLDLERLTVVADGAVYRVQVQAEGPAAEAALALAQFSALVDVRRAVMEEV